MLLRNLSETVLNALTNMPVVALLGPRQVGKTTLALSVAQVLDKESHYLDLESDADFNKLNDAESYLKRFDGQLLIIDEVQRKPDLFRLIRSIVDDRKRKGERSAQFLLLGSASRDLLQQSSESLAGRIRYLELTPFTASEIYINEGKSFDLEKLWLRGGFPDSYLASDLKESWNWRLDFISTYMERDLPMMGVGIAPAQLKRFWKMLAHYNGNQLNLSEIGRSLELSQPTVKSQLDILTEFFMVRQLAPWSGNLKKRLVKTPKVYLRDSGLLHSLLNVSNMESLLAYPSMGASWEGFVVENILSAIDSRWSFSYYRTATQVEVDLVLETPNDEIWAVEIKRASAPQLGRGFFEACKDIGATHKWIVNATDESYPMSNQVEVIGLLKFLALIKSKNE